MAHEDKTLVCVGCNEEFTFSVDEQKFFEEKGFESAPKRCTKCRAIRRKSKRKGRKGDGIYRSPAFEGSAPRHQKVRGRTGGRGEYRSPASFGQSKGTDDYRSPAFRQYEQIKPEDEYRAPGFREAAEIKVEEEYRSPGFREHADVDPKEEYRSPAYRDVAEKYVDEKPMFAILCAACGQDAMVPFLPEEKEVTYCQECYKTVKADEAAEAEKAVTQTAEPTE